MKIASLNKLTLLDYPEHLAAIIFTQGCNLKCPFCQNSSLISFEGEEIIDEEEILNYLKIRKNVLEGICISGGEPLMQKDIEIFIKKVKDLNYKVKLDTNGNFPNELQNLIDKHLVDYVAMDIKNSFKKYKDTCGVNKVNIDNVIKSIEILKSSSIDYEFRTTVVKELHNFDDIKEICGYIGDESNYYIQNYVDSPNVLKKGLHGFEDEELKEFQEKLLKMYPNLKIRGLYTCTN